MKLYEQNWLSLGQLIITYLNPFSSLHYYRHYYFPLTSTPALCPPNIIHWNHRYYCDELFVQRLSRSSSHCPQFFLRLLLLLLLFLLHCYQPTQSSLLAPSPLPFSLFSLSSLSLFFLSSSPPLTFHSYIHSTSFPPTSFSVYGVATVTNFRSSTASTTLPPPTRFDHPILPSTHFYRPHLTPTPLPPRSKILVHPFSDYPTNFLPLEVRTCE
ncbi:uncharacterized protein BP01DRAFT_191413 [Aspergillus saccharolyticus JOP 1030-1]|uniref:Uncharacterized protein n=1 Tax=Aspergillus saccharolyticus JOP 1030-1 TaxID=1450539 RepID=A0A318Z3M3_9EURO|nr:hypothetical protein BP01DRAFT_191413 [Aspergillus saccharolyticus JOP 1030-1]PYH40907.1 hypothetical protein BP01DRAFT_191413 [Aspergillus saccharolyticus JOP 1030-1]